MESTLDPHLLERRFDVHRRLADLALEGAGAAAMVEQLGTLLGRRLTLERVSGRQPSGADAVAIPLSAADTTLATLCAHDSDGLAPDDRAALEHGATLIALELAREQAACDAVQALHDDLLQRLLSSSEPPSDALRARAARLGVELDAAHRLVAFQPADGADRDVLLHVLRLARAQDGAAPGGEFVCRLGGQVVAALPERSGEPATWVRRVQRKTASAGTLTAAGMSAAHADLPTALREAQAALALACQASVPLALVTVEQLGPLRFLLDSPRTDHAQAFVADRLGDLARHDAAHQADLLKTLRAYVKTDGLQAAAAAHCGVHANTLKHRLQRIEEVLGRSPRDATVRFELRLAFELLDLLELLGVAPLSAPDRSLEDR